jgi:hypothetical protein
MHTDIIHLLCSNEDLPRIFRVMDGFDDVVFGSVVVVVFIGCDRTFLL